MKGNVTDNQTKQDHSDNQTKQDHSPWKARRQQKCEAREGAAEVPEAWHTRAGPGVSGAGDAKRCKRKAEGISLALPAPASRRP